MPKGQYRRPTAKSPASLDENVASTATNGTNGIYAGLGKIYGLNGANEYEIAYKILEDALTNPDKSVFAMRHLPDTIDRTGIYMVISRGYAKQADQITARESEERSQLSKLSEHYRFLGINDQK